MQIISRARWGARYDDGSADAPIPTEWWLHHSAGLMPDLEWVDADGDGVDDDEERVMRQLEVTGEQRFGAGISYTWCVPPSGRVYVGHSMHRRGAHTAGRNDRARAICLIGNYSLHRITEAQLHSVALIMVAEHRAGRARTHVLTGGHRDLQATECPGTYAHQAIARINLRAERLWAEGDRKGENMIENHRVHGRGNLRLICPVGKASAITAQAWISATVDGPQPGRLAVFFQHDHGGISDLRWEIGFRDGRSDRRVAVVPDGTTQINCEHDLPGDGTITIETLSR